MEVSTDAGASWNLVGNVGEGTNWYNNEIDVWWDGNTADTVGWINAEHLLDGVAGEASVIVRFVFDSDGSINTFEGFAIDDISITEQPPVNGTVASLLSPITDCGLTDTEEITALVTNLGSVSMDSVILSFQLNNGTIVTEVFNDTLVSNETDTFTFTSTIDLTVNGDYNLAVWVSAVGDGDTSNDTLMTMVTSVPTVNTLPYVEDFESGTGGWSSEGAINAWELGDPEGLVIDTAFSGVNAWATTLNEPNYENDELSYLTSPCFDFSAETDDPIIQFAIQYDIEAGFDGGWLEASIDGGMTWYLVGTVGTGENWYNNPAPFNITIPQSWDGASGEAGEWVIAENILDSVAGEADVQIRFAFATDASVNFFEGIAVDDINIFRQPELDLVALSMDAPEDGCNLENETVTMTFYNKGLQSVSGFELGFVVNGGTAQTETYTGTLNQGDTATYTFTTEFADLSAVGVSSIDVFTALAGDEDTSTDTVYNNEVENFGSGTPLSQTEEPEEAFISSALPEGTTSSIFFCGLPTSLDGCLEIVSVSIDSLEHTWLSDLDIFLISPAGDTLELSTDNGGSADNMSNVVFTDTSDNDITLQTVDIAPGFYAPEDTAGFAGLYNGQDPNGAWYLWIVDDTGGDVGNLLSWSMTFEDNAPVPTLNYGDTTICLTHVLTMETEMYDSYLWSTGNNTQSAQIFGDILGLGTHEVYVTVDQDGCTGISESITVTVDACAGVGELEGLSINVYPNPTSGDIILDITGESNGFVLNLMDVHGKVVYTETIGNISSAVRRSIDLSNVANGIYFLRMDDGKSATTRKLIKQ
jgi:subtilisin-like proprotein convertase family protein